MVSKPMESEVREPILPLELTHSLIAPPTNHRLTLNMKALPYKTVWVEYPDIAGLCKQIGAEPTQIKNGEPLYTMPVLQDLATGTVVSDSFKIAQYLDATYPNAPLTLVPAGTKAFHAMFLGVWAQKISTYVFPLLALPSALKLNPRSAEYFRRTRESTFGKTLEEFTPQGEARAASWSKARQGLTEIDGWLKENGQGTVFVMGDTPSFADAAIYSSIIWLEDMLGTDSKEWTELMAADEGRWAKLVEAFRKWKVVDEEGLKSA